MYPAGKWSDNGVDGPWSYSNYRNFHVMKGPNMVHITFINPVKYLFINPL